MSRPRCPGCPAEAHVETCFLSCEFVAHRLRASFLGELPLTPVDELGPVQGNVRALRPSPNAAAVLEAMADTFRARNAAYDDNYKMVGPIMKTLFPDGVSAELLGSDQFHLFELIIVKLTRLAKSGLQHEDSVRDVGVYAAMIDAIILGQQQGGN